MLVTRNGGLRKYLAGRNETRMLLSAAILHRTHDSILAFLAFYSRLIPSYG